MTSIQAATDETSGDTTPDDPSTRPVVRLRPGAHKRARAGHPWVYSNEVVMDTEARALPAGVLVTLVDDNRVPLGVATFNPHPLVSARLLTRNVEATIDQAFLADRIRRAHALRTRLFDAPHHRLVWSEADALPGLVADRFGDTLVLQLNTAGMDRLKDDLIAALEDVIAPANILFRNDTAGRALEGLPNEVRVVKGTIDEPVEVVENGVRFLTDPTGGQKTGWYFDHRENRARIARLAKGCRMLEVFSYLGGFGIQAAAGGAGAVTCLDRSRHAIELAMRSADLNGVADRCSFVRGEAFEELARLAEAGERYDVVVADPPAFVKSKKDIAAGIKGYRKLVRATATLVQPGGLLFIASCSHLVDAGMLAEQVRGALRDIRRTGRVLHTGGAGPDHPVHPYLPESAYLKTALLQLD